MNCMVVGLTGSIGTGKSLVAGMFRRHGAFVIDADKVAHQLYLSDKLRKALAKKFGKTILTRGGSIDRAMLTNAAFRSKAATAALARITHPVIISAIKNRIRQIRGSKRLCIVEAALLIESGFYKACDAVVLVITPLNKVISRTNLRAGDLRRRNSLQLAPALKLAFADYLIDNSAALRQTRRQVNCINACLTKKWK